VHDPTPAYAFVYKSGGVINIKTVSDTIRSAMVNAIVIVGDPRLMPRNDWTDQYIEQIFNQYCTRYGSVQPVSVSVTR
jgi:restriction endonuclease